MDLEEFLTENGIPVEQQQQGQPQQHPQQHGNLPNSGNNNSAGGGGSVGSSSASSSSGMTPNDQMSSGGEGSPQPMGDVHMPLHQQQQQQQVAPHLVGQYGPGPSSVRNNQGHNNHNGLMMSHGGMNNPQNLMRGPTSFHQSEDSRSPSPCGSSISRSSDESGSGMHPHHHGKFFLER